MPNYILAYHPDPQADQSAGDRDKWEAWATGLGDAIVNPGTPLKDSKTVSANGVMDGGGPNPLMGFSVVRAESLDAAIEMAKACPFLAIGTIEVAEMMEM